MNRSLFEPLVMFFGLTNLPTMFQTMINDIFWDLINWGVVIIYLDNILIFTKTIKEHHRVTKEVLQILRENKLFLKDEKCKFEKQRVEYLEMIISKDSITMDPAKVAGILE